MPRYALTVSYFGPDFAGFQLQSQERTVQGELENAASIATGEAIRFHCAGRTDAGVHASGMITSFDVDRQIKHITRFIRSLNGLTHPSVTVMQAREVPADFHPRFSCIAREYDYFVVVTPFQPVHLQQRVFWWKRQTGSLPVESLNQQLNEIQGSHDFQAFTRAMYKDDITIRYLATAKWTEMIDPLSDQLIHRFRILGNAFLHNMIRILVGTMLDIADGKIQKSLFEILQTKDRTTGGLTIPPHGLYFRNAYYDASEFGDTGLPVLDNFPVFGRKKMKNSDRPEIMGSFSR